MAAGAEFEVEGAEGDVAFVVDAAEVGLDLAVVVFVELKDAGVEAEPEGLIGLLVAAEGAVGGELLAGGGEGAGLFSGFLRLWPGKTRV